MDHEKSLVSAMPLATPSLIADSAKENAAAAAAQSAYLSNKLNKLLEFKMLMLMNDAVKPVTDNEQADVDRFLFYMRGGDTQNAEELTAAWQNRFRVANLAMLQPAASTMAADKFIASVASPPREQPQSSHEFTEVQLGPTSSLSKKRQADEITDVKHIAVPNPCDKKRCAVTLVVSFVADTLFFLAEAGATDQTSPRVLWRS
jgi:hypothetical protein